MKKTIMALIVSSAFLVGCVTISSYPDSWPKVAENKIGDCPDISGTYSNVGISAPDNARPVHLSDLFPLGETDVVKVVQTPDTIVISALMDGVETTTLTYTSSRWHPKKHMGFMCVLSIPFERQLMFNHLYNPPDEGIFPGIIFNHSELILFKKATDGSLLVVFSSSSGALIVLLPVGKSEQIWYRYSRVAD